MIHIPRVFFLARLNSIRNACDAMHLEHANPSGYGSQIPDRKVIGRRGVKSSGRIIFRSNWWRAKALSVGEEQERKNCVKSANSGEKKR